MHGESVLDLHRQLSRIIASRTRDEACGTFLTEPVVDRAGDKTTWYSRLEGPVRSVDLLDGAARETVEQQITGVVGRIAQLIETLEASARRDEQRLALNLRAALKHPSTDDLYLVGDRPVLVNWGCEPGVGGAGPVDLMGRLTKPKAPARKAPEPPVTEPSNDSNERKSPSRRRLWPFAPLLLLVLLLLFLLTRCQQEVVDPCADIGPVEIIFDNSGTMAFPVNMPENEVMRHVDRYFDELEKTQIRKSIQGSPPGARSFAEEFIEDSVAEFPDSKIEWVKENLSDEIERYGPPRNEIANDIVDALVADIPKRSALGLLAFSDCNSIDSWVAPTAAERQSIIKNTQALTPANGSPVGDSLSEAASGGSVEDGEKPKFIILITDGIESCGADPCAIAEQINQQSADLVVHVVQLGPETHSSCVADATGGRVYKYDSVDALLGDIGDAPSTCSDTSPDR